MHIKNLSLLKVINDSSGKIHKENELQHIFRRLDTMHNNIHHNGIQHIDTLHNSKKRGTQHNE